MRSKKFKRQLSKKTKKTKKKEEKRNKNRTILNNLPDNLVENYLHSSKNINDIDLNYNPIDFTNLEKWDTNNTIYIEAHGEFIDKGFVLPKNTNILHYGRNFFMTLPDIEQQNGEFINIKCPSQNTIGLSHTSYYIDGAKKNKVLTPSNTNISDPTLQPPKKIEISPHLYRENNIMYDIEFNFSYNFDNKYNTNHTITLYDDFNKPDMINKIKYCSNYETEYLGDQYLGTWKKPYKEFQGWYGAPKPEYNIPKSYYNSGYTKGLTMGSKNINNYSIIEKKDRKKWKRYQNRNSKSYYSMLPKVSITRKKQLKRKFKKDNNLYHKEFFIQSKFSGLKDKIGSYKYNKMLSYIREHDYKIKLSFLINKFLSEFNIIILSCKSNDSIYESIKDKIGKLSKKHNKPLRMLSYEMKNNNNNNYSNSNPYRETANWLKNIDNKYNSFNGKNYITNKQMLKLYKDSLNSDSDSDSNTNTNSDSKK